MIELDRLKEPKSKQIEHINIIKPRFEKLDNNVEIITIEGSTQDVTKIDFYFPAGLVQAGKPLLASTVSNMLEEGTKQHSSSQISESIDFYGAHIGASTSYHHSLLTLVTLSHYLENTLPIVADLIKNPTFPQSELDIYLNKKRQEFLLDIEKVRTLAARQFNTAIFGNDHPYGMIVHKETFDSITQSDLIKFHKKTYSPTNCQIIITGKPPVGYKELINKYFGNNEWKPSTFSEPKIPTPSTSSKQKHIVEKKEALQASLRIGKQIVTRNHPDYQNLQILNTIFGGYFGSRLMNTIREEKGYSYGISSFIVPLKNYAYWVISTEVNNTIREDALNEIYNEMNKLIKTPVSENELQLVKNFMLGDLLKNLDGPFAISDNIIGLAENNLDLTYYESMVHSIKTITPETIQSLAKKYLDPHSFITVIAG